MSTIYEVANLAGVSAKTAARILTGEGGRAANRVRVLEAAKQLGYVRNQQAANLRSGRSGLIGLIVPDIANPLYPFFCRLVHDAALKHGYRIIMANTYGNAREEESALRMFQANRIEGLILVCSEGQQDKDCDYLLETLLSQGIPVIIGGRPLRGIPADFFLPQNTKAIGKMVDYLVRTGRRKFAFIAGAKRLLASKERYQGYQEALRRHGIEENPNHVRFGAPTIEGGQKEMTDILRGTPRSRPDAVVCINDLVAIGAIRTAQEMGIRIPEDIAITGFDDISLAQLVTPRLTTIHQPSERMAREGIDLIVERIQRIGVSDPRVLSYDLDLIIRDSA